jgi:hypothetical protein
VQPPGPLKRDHEPGRSSACPQPRGPGYVQHVHRPRCNERSGKKWNVRNRNSDISDMSSGGRDVLDLSLNMLDEADGREPRLPAGDVWFGDGTAEVEGMRVGQTLFVTVHTTKRCPGPFCPLHNARNHHMRT